MSEEKAAYEGHAILELMGHRRIAGYVQQVEMFGAAMLRIDIPGPDSTTVASQFYGGIAIYCLTPTTEEVARAVALRNQPQPVHRWEMLPPAATVAADPTQRPYAQPDDDEDYGYDDLPDDES